MTEPTGTYPGAHEPFTGRLELLDGIVYEVDAGSNWWLTSDRFGQRLCRRPDQPTFPAGWRPGYGPLVVTVSEEDYERPARYNVVAQDGVLVLPGDEVVFLDRSTGTELVGVVQQVPGFVSIRTERGEWYNSVSREDVLRVTRLYDGRDSLITRMNYTRDNLVRRIVG